MLSLSPIHQFDAAATKRDVDFVFVLSVSGVDQVCEELGEAGRAR